MPDSFRSGRSATVFVAACGVLASTTFACGPSNGDGLPATYVIVFSLSDSPEDLERLSFTVTYENGDFSGSGSSVSCDLIAQDDEETADFDDDNDGTLTVEIDASENPLVEATDIVECEFVAGEQPTSNDFTVHVTAAFPADPDDVDVIVTSTDLASGASSLGDAAE